MDETTLVQPIIVAAKQGSHLEVIEAVAVASVAAYNSARDRTVWNAWLAGPFTKSVRRAKPSIFAACMAGAEHEPVERGEAKAVALPPAPYSEHPPAVRKTQVAGLDRPREAHSPIGGDELVIALNAAANMTTGKAAAQAAHALLAYRINHRVDLNRVVAVEVPFEHFDRLWNAADDDARIRDNGLTEVEPGTRTSALVDLAEHSDLVDLLNS